MRAIIHFVDGSLLDLGDLSSSEAREVQGLFENDGAPGFAEVRLGDEAVLVQRSYVSRVEVWG